jgi:hypothetical protein
MTEIESPALVLPLPQLLFPSPVIVIHYAIVPDHQIVT